MESIVNIENIPIKITRKSIKNINLRIDSSGNVKLSAPARLSQNEINSFVTTRLAWIQKHRIRFLQDARADLADLDAQPRLDLSRVLPQLIQKWEKIVGVKVSHYSVKLMHTRWGSCNPQKKYINLNSKLMHKPLGCLEYVIMHELTHILEASHNKRFYSLMDKFMPDWKIYKNQLF